jgi:hypothetical protein
MFVYELCEWIQNTESSTAIRDSIYLFPAIEGTHVLALSMSVGLVMWFDLRLAGFMMRHRSVSQVFDGIKAWMLAGFTVMFITGAILFWSLPMRCYGSSYFWAKMLLLILAGINIVLFHLTIDRRRVLWDKDPIPPLGARLAGVASLLLWMGVIFVGRTMAYFL